MKMNITSTISSTPIAAAVLIASLSLISPDTAWAQSVALGTIHGTVTDATGATLPGVTATLTSPALQVAQVLVVTDQDGNYRFIDLPAGTYRATFELPGFSTLIRQGLRIARFAAKFSF
jgi:Carboxypeptidase regulatory-like domain